MRNKNSLSLILTIFGVFKAYSWLFSGFTSVGTLGMKGGIGDSIQVSCMQDEAHYISAVLSLWPKSAIS